MLVLCSMNRPGFLHPNQPQRGQGSKKAERIIAEWQHQPKREGEHGHPVLLGSDRYLQATLDSSPAGQWWVLVGSAKRSRQSGQQKG